MLKLFSAALTKLRAMAGGWLSAALMLLLAFLMFLTVSVTLNTGSPDSLSLALLDEDGGEEAARFAEMLAGGDSPVALTVCGSRAEADEKLLSGAAEGLIVIEKDFASVLVSGGAALSYYPAAGASSAEAARELISGSAVTLRSRLRARLYAAELLGRELTGEELASLDAIAEENAANAVRAVEPFTVGAESGRTASIFSAFYARRSGFFAFVTMLMLLMLGSFTGSGDARAVALRMRTLRHGALFERAASLLALVLFGAALTALYALASGGISVKEIYAALLYILLTAALALLLGSLSGEARAELASPFIAFLTSLAGGCFADPEALGGALKTLSLFTPQGRFLAASSGGAVHLAVLAAAALALTLLLRLPALFGKRRVKLRELH